MRLTAAKSNALESSAPLAVLLVTSGKIASLPCGALGARAATLIARKVFKGEMRETLLLHAEDRSGPRALLLIGVGAAKDATSDDLRRAGAIAVKHATKLAADKIVVGTGGKAAFDADSLQAFGEGAVLASYRYSQKKVSDPAPKSVAVVSDVRGAATALKRAQALGEGANTARDLGDMPGNVATPTHLKNRAQAIARKGTLKFRAFNRTALKKMGYGGILAVNQGTSEMPYLCEIDYKPAKYKHTICVVGKGLTFDSGGISLKPSAKMEEMKYDMCGAGATLGVMQAVAALKPKNTRVIGIIGTTDNMPGPGAYKPGDVVKTGSGKTIEVINTDAEGRVVLSDCLYHATKFKPDAIVDMATLTGAILIAIGSEAAGLFCRDDELAAKLSASAERTGEKLWRMPTYDTYTQAIKSKFGDIKNSAGREGGSSTAAAFLFEFTEGFPHAHLDIAGTGWSGPKRDYNEDGWATGYGVRLLFDMIENWS